MNVVGLVCDIRGLRDRREWGADLVVLYERDFNVKIKMRADYGQFLTSLCSHFDVGNWSPIEHGVLEIASGQVLGKRNTGEVEFPMGQRNSR